MSTRGRRSRRRGAAIALSVVVAAAACGPIRPTPPGIAPLNDCAPPHDCPIDAPCSGFHCAVSDKFPIILVINTPETFFPAPSTTLTINYADLLGGGPSARPAECGATCDVIPPPIATTGIFLVLPSLQSDVGDILSPPGIIALPSHVRYRPLWQPPGSTAFTEATLAGLPSLPIDAQVTFPGGIAIGPGSTPTIGWSTPLYQGTYERTIQPDPPLDQIFPPEVTIVPGQNNDLFVRDGVDLRESLATMRSLRIVRDGDDASLEGWTVYLRDTHTTRRVSQIHTLHDATIGSTFILNTIRFGSGDGHSQVVVAPPAGVLGLPTFINNTLPGGQLAAQDVNGDPIPLHYPALPESVLVTGTVQVTSPTPVEADLVIREVSLTTLNPKDPALNFIHYQTRTKTVGGRWQVRLPPGQFDVYVIPNETSGLSAASLRLDVAVQTSEPDPFGKNLQVPLRTRTVGTCTTVDGRAVGAAEVQALPAAELTGVVDQERWPRPQRTMTDANGRFAMQLDWGTYDILVKPAEGSAFPWIISHSHNVGPEGVDLGTLRVPYPFAIDRKLLWANDINATLSRALVRAFAFPTAGAGGGVGGGGAGSGGAGGTAAPGVAIQIGQALTDDSGHFQMFVTPPE